MPLPIVVADGDGLAYQSGLVAVEGCAELDVKVDTPARQVDVGELADAEYQPGRRLLGAYGFVGDPPAGEDRRDTSSRLRPVSRDRPAVRARHQPLARRAEPDAGQVQAA